MKLQSVMLVLVLTVASGLIGSMITSSVSAQHPQPVLSTQADPQSTIPPRLGSPIPGSAFPGSAIPGSAIAPSLGSATQSGVLPSALPMMPSSIMPAMPGRYQVTTTHMNNNIDTVIILCDSATGQCWNGQIGSSNWNDMGTPAKPNSGSITINGSILGQAFPGIIPPAP